ncbi:2-phosphosulfolactate phosphatase [Thermodesulfatator indicus DSM 15286]|uniref:Probable 2-phosphosulfolactate phosphatase n=1 Tax=Thermodesulfatator indicus (strain DSM 15286 / JCM 11887 / CIR29812) TaxID=667014 RepID=F8ACS0_THEID|nr:2-phosphosulfolactate phosphatase [Thermodesulfatator indicus]AEH44711.1 2-phosphosulfolactate phosphatase [Thermodesulfatator indicus DSM 15286]
MKRIKVLPVPKPIETEGLIVLVDILRATSTIVTALSCGALRVKPVASIEEALLYSKQDYLLAGERECVPPEGFQAGNSPIEAQNFAQAKVVLTTTNGTKALSFVKRAKAICAGAFLNLAAVSKFAERFEEVTVLCAGTNGDLSLEDFLWAGKFLGYLFNYERENDAAIVAFEYAREISDILKEIIKSPHARRLEKFGFYKDIEFCARLNIYNTVPILTSEGFVGIEVT